MSKRLKKKINLVTKKVSKWDYRFFHVYSDYKLIKELDVKEARMSFKNRQLIVSVGKTFINFHKGQDNISIHKQALLKILNVKKGECIEEK